MLVLKLVADLRQRPALVIAGPQHVPAPLVTIIQQFFQLRGRRGFPRRTGEGDRCCFVENGQIGSANGLGDVAQMLPHRLGVIQVTGLHYDHRISVQFEHPPDQLVPLNRLGIAVQRPAHAVQIDCHLRRLMESVRVGGQTTADRHLLAAFARREMVFVQKGLKAGLRLVRLRAALVAGRLFKQVVDTKGV